VDQFTSRAAKQMFAKAHPQPEHEANVLADAWTAARVGESARNPRGQTTRPPARTVYSTRTANSKTRRK